MKTNVRPTGFTALELLVVVAVIAVLLAMLLPELSRPKRNNGRITCINNLRQIGIGFRLYATDGDPYPSFTNEVEAAEAWRYFQVPGKEIGSPKVLICPTDPTRTSPALDFETPSRLTANNFSYQPNQTTTGSRGNNALSFFYGIVSQPDEPYLILAGDRNISTNATLLSQVILTATNKTLAWTSDMHKDAGNVVLADGSAHQVNTKKLRKQIALATNIVQRFVLP